MTTVTATIEAQTLLGVPALIDINDSRLINPEGIAVYFLDEEGNICNYWTNPSQPVSVTAQEVVRHARAHWGSANGGGIGHTI